MSYRIEYGTTIVPQQTQNKEPIRLRVMTAAFLLLFTLCVRQFFPSGTEKLRSCLLPERLTSTQQALDYLMGDLRHGEPLGQALTAFCASIIFNEQALPN